METKLVSAVAVLLFAGCFGSPTESADIPSGDPIVEPDLSNATKTWNFEVNLTTRGSMETAGRYHQAGGIPDIDGVYESTDFNCVTFAVKGLRLVNASAVAAWSDSGPEQNLLLYLYLKESSGPFRGGENVRGQSPLAHTTDFKGVITSTEWITFGLHPSTGLPAWRGAVELVNLKISMDYIGETPPIVHRFSTCSPQPNDLV